MLLIIGFLLLILGADLLIQGSSNIAKNFHIPEIVIGLTIVAIGTSLPELMITISSTSSNATDLTIGNAIGSNICNLLLILGLITIMKPIEIDKSTKIVYLPVALASTIIILVLAMRNSENVLNFKDGIILLVFYVLYFIYPIITEFKDIVKAIKEDKQKNIKPKNIFLSILYIIAGITLLKIGGDLVVDKSVELATKYGITEKVIGLTIVAIGTALPELITSIVAVYKKDDDLAVGNLVGSCILNSLLILGTGAILTPLAFPISFVYDTLFLCFAIILIWIFCFVGNKNTITEYKGATLVIMFLIYMLRLVM